LQRLSADEIRAAKRLFEEQDLGDRPRAWRARCAAKGEAVPHAIFSAIGIRPRDLPITLDTLLPGLPPVALVPRGRKP
jgi:hypothetical protein